MINSLNYIPLFLKRHIFIKLLIKVGLLHSIQKISFNGNSKIYVDLNDPEPRNVYLKGEFDPFFFRVSSSFLHSKSQFFDIGSNVGFCTFGLTSKVTTSINYHLFEANKNLCFLLKKSKELYPQCSIVINNACISDTEGTSSFSVVNEETGQSHVSEDNNVGYKIRNLLLDDYCKKKDIQSIDFMKMDIEGYELNALRGATSLLKNQKIKSLYLEIMPKNFKRYNLSHFDVLSYLKSFGYKLFFSKVEDKHLIKRNTVKFRDLELLPFDPIEYPNEYKTDILAISECYDIC